MTRHFFTTKIKHALFFSLLTTFISHASQPKAHINSPQQTIDKEQHNHAHSDEHNSEHKEDHNNKHLDDHDDEHGDTHTDKHDDEGHIKITAQMLKTVGIETATASAGEIKKTLTLYGKTVAEPSAISKVSARFAGLITKLPVNIGDKVTQGDIIAEVESNNSLSRYNITAPISGVITERFANPGEVADSQVLLVIANYQQLWLELEVFPSQQAKISSGQNVIVTTEYRQTKSVIKQLLPTHSQTPFALARVPLDNSQGNWSAGSLLSADVVINKQAMPLVIDNNAVQIMDGKQVIFIKNRQGFELREINLGETDNTCSQVIHGLKLGETYAIKNSYLLKAELEKSSAEHHH